MGNTIRNGMNYFPTKINFTAYVIADFISLGAIVFTWSQLLIIKLDSNTTFLQKF